MPDMPELIETLRPVARLLPPEEWAARTPDFAMLDPDHSFVVVVEDGGPGGAVLAQWASLTAVHVEGIAVTPEAQGHAGVARALLQTMVETLTKRGVREVLTQAETPEMAEMVRRSGGQPVPGTTWVIPLGQDGR